MYVLDIIHLYRMLNKLRDPASIPNGLNKYIQSSSSELQLEYFNW